MKKYKVILSVGRMYFESTVIAKSKKKAVNASKCALEKVLIQMAVNTRDFYVMCNNVKVISVIKIN